MEFEGVHRDRTTELSTSTCKYFLYLNGTKGKGGRLDFKSEWDGDHADLVFCWAFCWPPAFG